MIRRHLDLLAWALLLLVPCAPVWPQDTSGYCYTGQTGQAAGFTLSAHDLADGSSLSTAGYSVVELSGGLGEYRVINLQNATATDDRLKLLMIPPAGNACLYLWPDAPPRATQAVAWAPTYAMTSGRQVGVGDAGVDFALRVGGLSANPAGSTVEFDLWCKGTHVVDSAAACVAGDPGCCDGNPLCTAPSVNADGIWSAALWYDTQPADLATAATNCTGRFILSPGTGQQISLPPSKSLTIDILDAAPTP